MMKSIGHFAKSLANKHPILDAALVVVGGVALADLAYTKIFKPAPSTAQPTGTGTAATATK